MNTLSRLSLGTIIGLSSMALFATSASAGSSDDGNLYGAAQACGVSTAGLPYYQDPNFELSRQNALRSRQDCSQVSYTTSRSSVGFLGLSNQNLFGYAVNSPNSVNDGNLYGAVEVCGYSTAGLPIYSDANFEAARQKAHNSRQDCAQVGSSLGRTSNISGVLGNNTGLLGPILVNVLSRLIR